MSRISPRNVAQIKPQHVKPDELGIIIPCAGISHKMKVYGPKSIIQISDTGQTVLGRQLSIFKNMFPKADITVVLGYEKDKVFRHIPSYVRVVENENFDKTNVARSIDLGLKATPNNRVLIVYGDLVFNRPTIEGIVDDQSKIVVDHNDNFTDTEAGLIIVNDYITNMSYGLPKKWGQMAYLCGNELVSLRNVAYKQENHIKFGFEILNDVIDAGGEFRAHYHKKMKIVEIDSSKDIIRAHQIESSHSY